MHPKKALTEEERRKTMAPTAVVVSPFAITADHPRNSDLLLQCLPGEKLRSKFDATKGSVNAKTGKMTVPKDQVIQLGDFPRVPGMQLLVDPQALTWEITDPLFENKKLCEEVEQSLKEKHLHKGGKLTGVAPRRGKIDEHSMKTLCREMLNIVQAGEAVVSKGKLPDLEDITDLPGHFLLNPGSIVANTQPRYEKDWASWVNNLNASGH